MPTTDHAIGSIGIIGGTGAEGRGLATRFALAGHPVTLGSRDAERAASAATTVTAALAGRTHAPVGGDTNEGAAEADAVVIAVPYAGHRETLAALAPRLAGRIVIDAVVPLRFDRGPYSIDVPDGSATEEAAALLPESHVIGAFHNLPAELLLDPAAALDADALVCGSDAAAKAAVMALAGEIAGVRPVDAGPLRFARFVEQLTVLLIGINGRYRATASPQFTGLPDRPPAARS